MSRSVAFRRMATVLMLVLAIAVSLQSTAVAVPPFGPDDAELTILVMDPMAGPLACDCVQGYAQRRYEELSKHLTRETKLTCRVVWYESLELAIHHAGSSQIDLVIGKDSVIRAQAEAAKLDLIPLVSLTDKEGSTMQRGLFVVTKNSNAASLLDLDACQVYFGPPDCDEKYAAAIAKLRDVEVAVRTAGTCESCSVAARKLLEASNQQQLATVISSYAAPLLEGCGTIKKGDLRVIGETDPVRFVSAFANKKLDQAKTAAIQNALLKLSEHSELLKSLESRDGFVEYGLADPVKQIDEVKKKVTQ
jgi:ABC-type phosphate/phosphonate transport system substrate-binding protein